MDWAQSRHGSPNLLHLFAWDGVFMAATTLAVAELFVTEHAGQEVAIPFLGGIFLF